MEGSPTYPNRFHEKQNEEVTSARMVTLLAGPDFLHINTLAVPAGVNSVEARESEHGRALLSALGSGKGVNARQS